MVEGCTLDIGDHRVVVEKGMKRITEGKYISRGYRYLNYEIRNHGYYEPERCVWWEAVNIETGEADFHAHSKREIRLLIDRK